MWVGTEEGQKRERPQKRGGGCIAWPRYVVILVTEEKCGRVRKHRRVKVSPLNLCRCLGFKTPFPRTLIRTSGNGRQKQGSSLVILGKCL